jgi:hypothetical protein
VQQSSQDERWQSYQETSFGSNCMCNSKRASVICDRVVPAVGVLRAVVSCWRELEFPAVRSFSFPLSTVMKEDQRYQRASMRPSVFEMVCWTRVFPRLTKTSLHISIKSLIRHIQVSFVTSIIQRTSHSSLVTTSINPSLNSFRRRSHITSRSIRP